MQNTVYTHEHSYFKIDLYISEASLTNYFRSLKFVLLMNYAGNDGNGPPGIWLILVVYQN